MFAASLSLGLVLLPFVSAGTVHDVSVGDAGALAFGPEAIFAQAGDQVVFHFKSKNHTATQTAFGTPCQPLPGGLNSGFMPVAANSTDSSPTFTVEVKDTKPIWIFCAQTNPVSHCGKGMVFAINCGADGAPNSFTNFKKAALDFGAQIAASSAPASAPASASSDVAWTTAAYGDVTIPAAPSATPVTQAITLGSDIWTTTYSSYPGSPAPTPASAEGQVHKVIVGGSGNLTFEPSHIAAQPRDTITFEFRTKNHTVTQSSFADPCRKLNQDGVVAIDSGFMPVDPNSNVFPTFNVTVSETTPLWFYCRQQTPVSHCGQGMVFAVNSDESSARSFAAFQKVATTLNGTAAAASAPAPSTTTANGAFSIRFGGPALALAVAPLVAFFL